LTFVLEPCYPNPFNPSTTISFTLNKAFPVKLSVYNQLGQEVITIINNQMSPGDYRMTWDASQFSSGVYLISLESSLGIHQTQKVILIK
jgi:flagellar hook assembly protein FlgD